MGKDKQRISLKAALIALVVTLIGPLVWLVALFFPQTIESNMNAELASVAGLIGEQATMELYQSVLNRSDSLLIQSGFIGELREILLPAEYLRGEPVVDDILLGQKTWEAIDNAIYGFALNVDFTLFRLYSFKMWVLAIIIFTIAAATSGYWMREIKKHGFEYSSPLRHGLGRRTLYSLPVIALLYLILPLALPVYFVPLATVVYSGAILVVVSNTIKRA